MIRIHAAAPGLRAACLLLGAGLLALPSTGRADIERIREKALELQQNLNRHSYRYLSRAETPNVDRVYKDFAFLLKQSKLDEVKAEGAGDPLSEKLRLFLIESIVNSELAAFEDEQQAFKQSAKAPLDAEELDYTTLRKRLATAPETAQRRKIYSSMDKLFETISVFGNEILKRRTDKYAAWGFENFADFYSQREALDLDAVDKAADAFLASTQELYDGLLETVAQELLGIEARKIRIYDVPFLVQGMQFEQAFPLGHRNDRMSAVMKGLGVEIGSNLILDDRLREGKSFRPSALSAVVPTEVYVSVNPVGGILDDADLLVAAGEAQIFTQSQETRFEAAYLVEKAAQAALAYVPMLVLDEPGWASKNGNADHLTSGDYLHYRAFAVLYEARRLAAASKLEIAGYTTGGGPELEQAYRDVMDKATGARISAIDAKRLSEVLTPLESASRFQGLLLAAGICEKLRESAGETWYEGGQAGERLLPMWRKGGRLASGEIATAFELTLLDSGPIVRHVDRILAASNHAEKSDD